MPLEQIGNALTFEAFYTNNGSGATGETVTLDVWELTAGGVATEIVTAGNATEIGDGLYYYQLASGSVDAEAIYTAVFKCAGTVDQAHIVAGWVVGPTWVENVEPTATVVDAVWDEVISTAAHTTAQSAGKRLRRLSSPVVTDGTAQSATNNTIVLENTASAVDGTYDPSLIYIESGIGLGQCRLILEYAGATRTAVVDRNWKVNPDATSDYVVFSNIGREHVNEGLARAASVGSITLNTLASAQDNAYIGQVVFIRSGTGEDQGRRIAAYDGTTRIATVQRDWDITPDATSAYVMLPTGMITDACIGDAVLSRDVSNVEDTASDNSLAEMLLAAFESVISGGTWTIYKTDHATTFNTRTVTLSGTAQPIVEVT